MKIKKNHRRIMAFGLVVLVTVILFLSFFFVIKHIKHECTGENCPVCAQIRVCINALHLISVAVGSGAVILFGCLFVRKIKITYLAGLFLLPTSLVRLKIRLDD